MRKCICGKDVEILLDKTYIAKCENCDIRAKGNTINNLIKDWDTKIEAYYAKYEILVRYLNDEASIREHTAKDIKSAYKDLTIFLDIPLSRKEIIDILVRRYDLLRY